MPEWTRTGLPKVSKGVVFMSGTALRGYRLHTAIMVWMHVKGVNKIEIKFV